MLYAIVDRRHEKRSTVVTTNLSFKQWGTVFPGAACVVALVDRFAQHCNVVDIDADSWRQKNALAREGREGATDGTRAPAGAVAPSLGPNGSRKPNSDQRASARRPSARRVSAGRAPRC